MDINAFVALVKHQFADMNDIWQLVHLVNHRRRDRAIDRDETDGIAVRSVAAKVERCNVDASFTENLAE